MMKRLRRKRRVESPGPASSEADCEAPSTRTLYELHLHTARLFQSGSFTNEDLGNLLRSHISFLQEQIRTGKDIFSDSPSFVDSFDLLEPNQEHPFNSAPRNEAAHLNVALSPRRMITNSVRDGLDVSVLLPPQLLFPEIDEAGHPVEVRSRERIDSEKVERSQAGTDLGERRGLDVITRGLQVDESRKERVDQRKPRSKKKVGRDNHFRAESNLRNNDDMEEERPLHNSVEKEPDMPTSHRPKTTIYGTIRHLKGRSPEMIRKRKAISNEGSNEGRKQYSAGGVQEPAVKVQKKIGTSSGLRYSGQSNGTSIARAGPRQVPPKLPSNVESLSTSQHMRAFPMGDRDSLITRPRQDESPHDIDPSKVVEDTVNGMNNYIDLPNPSSHIIPCSSNPLPSRRDVQNSLMSSMVHDYHDHDHDRDHMSQRNKTAEISKSHRSCTKNETMGTTGGDLSPERALHKYSVAHTEVFCATEGDREPKGRTQAALVLEKGTGADRGVETAEEVECGRNEEMEDENLGESEETVVERMKDRNEKSCTESDSIDFPLQRDVELVDGVKSLVNSNQGELFMESSPPLLPYGGSHLDDRRCSIENNGTESGVPYIRSVNVDQLSGDGNSSVVNDCNGRASSAEGSEESVTVRDEEIPNHSVHTDPKTVSQINISVDDRSSGHSAAHVLQDAHAIPSESASSDCNTVDCLDVILDGNGRAQDSSLNGKQQPEIRSGNEGKYSRSEGVNDAGAERGISTFEKTKKVIETDITRRGDAAAEGREDGVSVDAGLDNKKRSLGNHATGGTFEKVCLGDGNLPSSGAMPWNKDLQDLRESDKKCSSADNVGASNPSNGEDSVLLDKDTIHRIDDNQQELTRPSLREVGNTAQRGFTIPHSRICVQGATDKSSPRGPLKGDSTISRKELRDSQFRERITNADGQHENGQRGSEILSQELNETTGSGRPEPFHQDDCGNKNAMEGCSEIGGLTEVRQEPPVFDVNDIVRKESGCDRGSGRMKQVKDTKEASIRFRSETLLGDGARKEISHPMVSCVGKANCTPHEKEKHVRFAIDARKICSPRNPANPETAGNPVNGITAACESLSSLGETPPKMKDAQDPVHQMPEETQTCGESPTTTLVERARQLITPVFEDFNEEEVRVLLSKMKSKSLTGETCEGENDGERERSEEADTVRLKSIHPSDRSKALVTEENTFPASFKLWVGDKIECISPSDALDMRMYRDWHDVELSSAAVSYALFVIEKDAKIEVCSESHVLAYMHSMKCRVKGSWVREDKVLKSCRLGIPEESYWYFIPMLITFKNKKQWALVCIQGMKNAFKSLQDFSNLEEADEDIVKTFGSVHIVLTADIEIPKLYLECIDKFIWGVIRSAYYTVQNEYPKIAKSRQIRSIVQRYMSNVYCINIAKEHSKESSGAYIVSAASALCTSESMDRFHDDVLRRTAGRRQKKNGSVQVGIPGMIPSGEVDRTMVSTSRKVSALLQRLG